MPATKSLIAGTWARTLFAAIRSARLPSATSLLASSTPKKSTMVSTPRSRGRLGDVRSRIDSERGNGSLDEVLEQVAVVRGELDDQAAAVEPEAVDHRLAVDACMLDPGVGKGGEVCVLPEDLLSGDVCLELHEQAVVADAHVQRIEVLDAVELVGGQERLAQRRHAQVDERARERAAADSTGRQPRHGRRCARMRLMRRCSMHPDLLSLIAAD